MKAAIRILVLAAALMVAAPLLAGHQVTVILANYLSLDDLVSAGPNLRSLMNDGAVGLMNTGYRVKYPDVRYLTLGTGIKPNGANGMAVCYETQEQVDGKLAGEVYRSQTGKVAPQGSVVCLGFSRILRANQKPPFRMEAIGLLGDSFHEAGLKTTVIGSRDADEKNRRAGFIAMDRNGLVDSHRMSAQGLLVIEPADFNSLEDMRELLSKQAYQVQRTKALRNLDNLIGQIRPHAGALIVCSPCPVVADKGFQTDLAPIILLRPKGMKGLLTSGTTRTDGLISNMDVAPTILSQANLPIPDFVAGRPAQVLASAKPIEELRRMDQVVTQEYRIRIPVLAAIGVLAILAATMMEITLGRKRAARAVLQPIFLFLLSLPASLLIVDGFRIVGVGTYLIALVATASAIAALAYAVFRASKLASPLPIIHGTTAFLILGDVFTGSHLLQRSMLTCNPICGMRYYGLGNEYMGMLVVSALLFALLLWKPKGMSIPVLIWFAVVTLAIGYPSLGADVGGLLTAIATFGVAWIILSGMKFRTRHALILVLLALLGVGLFAAVDMLHADRVSHLGRSVFLAREYGWQWLGYLIAGKMMMHLGILKTPQVHYTLLGSVPFFMLHGRRARSESAVKAGVVRTAGWPALIVGMTVAFLFNDSGIVPAGLMFAACIISILYLRLQEAA